MVAAKRVIVLKLDVVRIQVTSILRVFIMVDDYFTIEVFHDISGSSNSPKPFNLSINAEHWQRKGGRHFRHFLASHPLICLQCIM
jgi:hypothetical protein